MKKIIVYLYSFLIFNILLLSVGLDGGGMQSAPIEKKKVKSLEYYLRDEVFRSNQAGVKSILALKANPNVSDKEGRSPLLYAAFLGSVGIVESLLAYDADPDLQDLRGATAISVATYRKSNEVVQLLIKYKADPNLPDRRKNLPILYHNYTTFKITSMLLKAKANPNVRHKNGKTPLESAKYLKHDRVVDLLLEYGAK